MRHITLYVDEKSIQKAKNLGYNISQVLRDTLDRITDTSVSSDKIILIAKKKYHEKEKAKHELELNIINRALDTIEDKEHKEQLKMLEEETQKKEALSRCYFCGGPFLEKQPIEIKHGIKYHVSCYLIEPRDVRDKFDQGIENVGDKYTLQEMKVGTAINRKYLYFERREE